MKKNIPNIITSLNLLSGGLGIIFAFEVNLILAAWMVFIAATFDFLDGFSARLLNARSNFGKELDSLADMISFGLLPGIILYQLLSYQVDIFYYNYHGVNLIALGALLIPLFSALRLAKFNNDDTQTISFKGLPTPASALFIAAIPLMFNQQTILFTVPVSALYVFLNNSITLLGIIALLSFLMVSDLPLLSLKFKGMSFVNNKYQYFLIIISAILIITLQFFAIPLILLIYLIMPVIKT